MIKIYELKNKFAFQFPESPLTPILLQERNELTAEELLAKVSTWLAILNANKKK
jgi:hypothetical protein